MGPGARAIAFMLALLWGACQPATSPERCADDAEAESCVAGPAPRRMRLVREDRERPSGPTADMLCGFVSDRLVACELPKEVWPACPAANLDLTPFRQDYLWRMALCIEGAPCSSFTGEATAWPSCHDVAARMVPVTPPLRSFCFAASRRAAQCDRRGEMDQTGCLVERRYLAADAIAKAHGCLAEACDAIPGCLQQAMGTPRGVP